MRRPKILPTSNTLATLQAGPAISMTRAAPGVRPFIINATAMGMLPVAQRYIGTDRHNTNNIDMRLLSLNSSKQLSGTATVSTPATTNPTTSHFPTLSIIST